MPPMPDAMVKHKVYPVVEVRPAEDINSIVEALEKSNEASVRYVIDLSTLTEANRANIESKPPGQLEPSTKLSWGGILKSLAGGAGGLLSDVW